MSDIRFTKTVLEKLPVAAHGQRDNYCDTATPGLMVRVTHTGAKTFYVRRRINGVPERIRLGAFPQMTIEQARAKAAQVNGAIAEKRNPAEARRAARAEPLYGETFERFLKDKRNRSGKPLSARTTEGYRKVTETYLSSFKTRKLSEITPELVKRTLSKITSPAQLNHAKAIVSSVFNWARDEGITDLPNPASRVKTKAVPSRERFLLPSEMPRFFAAVEQSPQRDFFLLALLTGARRSNLQEMRWRDLNLEECLWTIPKTKNGSAQTITLPPEAIEIIVERKRQAIVNAVYVFPGTGRSGHLEEPKKAWHAVLAAAGLENLRIHDLRRTMGSWQARAGASTVIIGKSLGHRSQATTAIYSRLDLDPVRQSVEQAATAMREAGRATGAKVIPLKCTA